MDTDPADDFRVYTRFENKDEFITLRDQLLGLDLYAEPSQEQAQSESQISAKLSLIVGLPLLTTVGSEWLISQ